MPAIAAIFLPVPPILAPIADVFQAIAAAADMARVPPILAPVAHVFASIAAILAPVADVFGAIADAVAVGPIGEGRRGQDGQRREERGRDEQAGKAARSNHDVGSSSGSAAFAGLDTRRTGLAASRLNRHDVAAVAR